MLLNEFLFFISEQSIASGVRESEVFFASTGVASASWRVVFVGLRFSSPGPIFFGYFRGVGAHGQAYSAHILALSGLVRRLSAGGGGEGPFAFAPRLFRYVIPPILFSGIGWGRWWSILESSGRFFRARRGKFRDV